MEDQSEKLSLFLEKSATNERTCPPDAPIYLRKRYLVAALVFVGWALTFLLRVNLSISLVEMTSSKSVIVGNETVIKAAEFDWSTAEKGIILSAFSWGLFASPLGALVGGRFGGVKTFGGGIVMTALLTTLSPIVMRWSLKCYIVVRILEGSFEIFSVVTYADVFVQWAPPTERSRLIAGSFLGSMLGTAISFPVCGTVAYYFNWEAVFYVTGGAAILWYIIWVTLVAQSPENDRLISRTERQYLMHVNAHISQEKIIYPWKEILTSKAVFAYVSERFACAWSVSFFTYCLPIYVKDLHDINIQQVGFLSSIPHLLAVIGLTSGAIVADILRNRQILSITNVHKVYLIFAQTIAVILFFTIAFWDDSLVGFICLSVLRLLYTISDTSYMVLPVDIGGRYAGFLLGIAALPMSVAYTLNPIIMGYIVTNHTTAEWGRYFMVISVFNIWGALVFWIYGSGELQPWAVPQSRTKVDELQETKNLMSKDGLLAKDC